MGELDHLEEPDVFSEQTKDPLRCRSLWQPLDQFIAFWSKSGDDSDGSDDFIYQSEPIKILYSTESYISKNGLKKPITINIQPSKSILQNFPELLFDDIKITHEKLLGHANTICLDFTIVDNEILNLLLKNKNFFDNFLVQINNNTKKEFALRVAGNYQINFLRNNLEYAKEVKGEEILFRSFEIVKDPRNFDCLRNDLYVRIDKKFEDGFLKNVFGS